MHHIYHTYTANMHHIYRITYILLYNILYNTHTTYTHLLPHTSTFILLLVPSCFASPLLFMSAPPSSSPPLSLTFSRLSFLAYSCLSLLLVHSPPHTRYAPPMSLPTYFLSTLFPALQPSHFLIPNTFFSPFTLCLLLPSRTSFLIHSLYYLFTI